MDPNICSDMNDLWTKITNDTDNQDELNTIFSSLTDIQNSMKSCNTSVNNYLDDKTNLFFNKRTYNDSIKLKKRYNVINILKLLSILLSLVIISIMYYKNKK